MNASVCSESANLPCSQAWHTVHILLMAMPWCSWTIAPPSPHLLPLFCDSLPPPSLRPFASLSRPCPALASCPPLPTFYAVLPTFYPPSPALPLTVVVGAC